MQCLGGDVARLVPEAATNARSSRVIPVAGVAELATAGLLVAPQGLGAMVTMPIAGRLTASGKHSVLLRMKSGEGTRFVVTVK